MNVLIRLSKLASDWWCYFTSGRQGLRDLVVRLLLRLENGIYHVLTMLFETASIEQPEEISVSLNAQEIVGRCDQNLVPENCEDSVLIRFCFFVELLLSELDVVLRTSETTPPLIRSFYSHVPQLKLWLLSDNALKASYATRMFIVLGKLFYLFVGRLISHNLWIWF